MTEEEKDVTTKEEILSEEVEPEVIEVLDEVYADLCSTMLTQQNGAMLKKIAAGRQDARSIVSLYVSLNILKELKSINNLLTNEKASVEGRKPLKKSKK